MKGRTVSRKASTLRAPTIYHDGVPVLVVSVHYGKNGNAWSVTVAEGEEEKLATYKASKLTTGPEES